MYTVTGILYALPQIELVERLPCNIDMCIIAELTRGRNPFASVLRVNPPYQISNRKMVNIIDQTALRLYTVIRVHTVMWPSVLVT